MNILNTHKAGSQLKVKVHRALNLWIKNMIESRISDEITEITIDLTDCPFVDSEGVIFMYQWQHAGNGLTLVNPPDILFEILDILELRETWNPNYIKTKEQ